MPEIRSPLGMYRLSYAVLYCPSIVRMIVSIPHKEFTTAISWYVPVSGKL